jgi:hypothetical protein
VRYQIVARLPLPTVPTTQEAGFVAARPEKREAHDVSIDASPWTIQLGKDVAKRVPSPGERPTTQPE